MLKLLPVQKISGRLYFRDERLLEYRAVDNPDVRFRIKDYDMMLALEILEEQSPGRCVYTLLSSDDELFDSVDDEIV